MRPAQLGNWSRPCCAISGESWELRALLVSALSLWQDVQRGYDRQNNDFGTPEIDSQFGDALAALKRYNGLPVYAAYFPEAMQRLRDRYLSVPLNTVLQPVSHSAAQAAADEQAAAANAPVATERELREAARQRYLFTQNSIPRRIGKT
jgi:hypothetical protein